MLPASRPASQHGKSALPHHPATCYLPPSPPTAPVSVFLYALLTVLFSLAGLAYLVLPQ